jgi:polar amino acid transport system ATP-binding protein
VRGLAKSGMTMVVVTHEMAFAREVADHVMMLAGGLVMETAPAETFFAAPAQARTQQFLRSIL